MMDSLMHRIHPWLLLNFPVLCIVGFFFLFDWVFIACESSDEWQVGTGNHLQLYKQHWFCSKNNKVPMIHIKLNI